MKQHQQCRQYLLIVRTRPLPGREAEYHAWYDDTHLAEVLGLPGFAAARRFASRAVPPAAESDGRFLAVFTIETDDPVRAMAEFDAGRALMPVPDCLDADAVSFELWEALGPERRGQDDDKQDEDRQDADAQDADPAAHAEAAR